MSLHENDDFKPPTVELPTLLHTYTNHSPIPSALLNTERVNELPPSPPSIIIGIDEAGRGPIIGPMVYSLAYCATEFGKDFLPDCEFADSKKLTEPKRWELMKRICDKDNELSKNLGYAITSLSSLDISTSMQRPSNLVINLNEQAHTATIELIKSVIQRLRENVSPDIIIEAVYIDTVGPPASYKTKLRKFFSVEDVKEIRVEKKADATYPIVSAASVVAKVTRDWFIECAAKENVEEPQIWGSGYPSDPRTSAWINSKLDPWFGWDHNIRYSWGTARDALNKSKESIEMRWEHDLVKKHGFDDVAGLLTKTGNTSSNTFEVDRDWFVL